MNALSLVTLGLGGVATVVLVACAVTVRRQQPGSALYTTVWLGILLVGAAVAGMALGLVHHADAEHSHAAWPTVIGLVELAYLVLSAWLALVVARRLPEATRELQRSTRMYSAVLRRVGSMPAFAELRLTSRERDVVEVLRTGRVADADIAAELGVSRATAATHVRNIMRKSGVTDRRDLVALGEGRRVRRTESRVSGKG